MTKTIHSCDRCGKIIDNKEGNCVLSARNVQLFDFIYKERRDVSKDPSTDLCEQCVKQLKAWLNPPHETP